MEKGEKQEKLPMGPTLSRPGPMLPMAETVAVKLVSKDSPSSETNRVAIRMMKI